ncbi:hypothetical protein [Nocardia sp. CA-119907]
MDQAVALEGTPVTRNIRTNMIAITQDALAADGQDFYTSEC